MIVGPYTLYPRLESAEHQVQLQLGHTVRHCKKKYTALALVKDKRGTIRLLAIATSNYNTKPKLLSLGSCTVLESNPSALPKVTECLQRWIDEQMGHQIVKVSPLAKPQRKRRRMELFDEDTQPAKKHKPKSVTKKVPTAQKAQVVKTMLAGTVEDLPEQMQPVHASTPLSQGISLQWPTASSTNLSLRLQLEEREIRLMQHQLISNELHSHEERERILQQLNDQRLRNLENQQMLLQALLYNSTGADQKFV